MLVIYVEHYPKPSLQRRLDGSGRYWEGRVWGRDELGSTWAANHPVCVCMFEELLRFLRPLVYERLDSYMCIYSSVHTYVKFSGLRTPKNKQI